jgi:uncharacterized repeat protein (TIGR03803 family)
MFKITPSGALTTLYNFCSQGAYPSCTDGEGPLGLIQATNGDFYGITAGGGVNTSSCTEYSSSAGCGTVFEITPSGALTTLHRFCLQSGCTDGAIFNVAGLVQATNGDLYGIADSGGAANPENPEGSGTVFKITPSRAFTTLYSFCGSYCADGGLPLGLVQGTDGNLYGTTFEGGVTQWGGDGTIFKITPGGSLTTLYSFCAQYFPGACQDGANTNTSEPLIQDTNGDFYGTASYGGTNNDGTVFSLSVGLGPFVKTQTTSGEVGATVKILGTDLTGATSVSFNGTAATFNVVSRYSISATVPTGATSGKVEVVTPIGTLSSNVAFRVLP